MKNIFSLILLTITLSGFSQDVRFGFTASPTFNFSSIESSNASAADGADFLEENSSRLGINYGVMLDYDFNGEDRYFLHSGVMLHHTGYEATLRVPRNEDTSYKVNVNYIEIPTILKLKTNEIGYLRYFGQFGLTNGIKISDKLKEPTTVKLEDIGLDTKTFYSGLNIGGGAEYTISDETSLVGGLYYVNGLTKTVDNSFGKLKNNQLGIRLGVYF